MLRRYGHDVQELTFDNDAIQGVAGQVTAAFNAVFSPGSFARVKEQLRSFQPDILHVHNFMPTLSPAVFFAAGAMRTPVVQTLHNFRMVCANGVLFRNGKPCERCVEQRSFLPAIAGACFRGSRTGSAVVGGTMQLHSTLGTWNDRIDRYIALTEFAAAKLGSTRLPASRIRVKANFVSDQGVGDGSGQYALFVGRLSDEKGLDVLLRADRSQTLPLPVTIVGDGPLRDRVVEACARKGSLLRYVGRQSSAEVIEWMKRASVLLLPSTCYEGFPVAVVEALSVGLPVIASRHGGLPEIVEEGKCGYLHEPGDAEALVAAMQKLTALSDQQYRELRDQARHRYLTRYSEAVNHDRLLNIYAEAIAEAEVRYMAKGRPDAAQAYGNAG